MNLPVIKNLFLHWISAYCGSYPPSKINGRPWKSAKFSEAFAVKICRNHHLLQACTWQDFVDPNFAVDSFSFHQCKSTFQCQHLHPKPTPDGGGFWENVGPLAAVFHLDEDEDGMQDETWKVILEEPEDGIMIKNYSILLFDWKNLRRYIQNKQDERKETMT